MARVRGAVTAAGPIFDDNLAQVFKGGVFAGQVDLAEEADDIMAAQIAAAGLVDSGALLRSVDIKTVRSSENVTGYALIAPTDVWRGTLTISQAGWRNKTSYVGPQRSPRVRRVKSWNIRSSSSVNRPTFEWLRRGMRNQRKMRPAQDFITRTATAVRGLDINGIVGKRIAEALNG